MTAAFGASLAPPYTLVAELTYRCPLRCGYCSNPPDADLGAPALGTDAWIRVLREAADLGVLGVQLTGGEPLLRRDLETLVAAARRRGLYATLVTSGATATPARLARLRAAGLDAIQLSLQDARAEDADAIAGGAFHARKLEVARAAREAGLALTINVVLHRGNADRVEALVALAAELRADRLELANVQLLGSALANRAALLPTRAQVARARAVAVAARARHAGRMEVVFVRPDYVTGQPRACMDGWARRYLVVAPDGAALPCHAAHAFPGLPPPSVRTRSLASIWAEAPLFRAFRGEEWMQAPCRTCARRASDFGGCRCQALALTGDPAAADPACAMAPSHGLVRAACDAADVSDVVPVSALARGARRVVRSDPALRSGGRSRIVGR